MSPPQRASALAKILLVGVLGSAVSGALAAPDPSAPVNPAPAPTILGIDGSRFTLNGRPAFLLGISYYGGLGAPEALVRRDLEDLQSRGFNWLRVWATWNSSGDDVSAIDETGRPRQPFLDRLKELVAQCDRRGLIVDVTLTRGPRMLPDLAAHRRALETLVPALKTHRNWYLDLANERDVRDQRHVPVAELKDLRALVRRLDPPRLVTASFGGHDLSLDDVRAAVLDIGVDFLCPHRPRTPETPAQTEAQTRATLALLAQLGRTVPVHYQEPFRRGYTDWQPKASDFLADLRGARAGGAAGWCFHNGQQRGADEPRRSFDLRFKRLFVQLDPEERKVIEAVQAIIGQ